jgi:hypothetical protein
MKRWDYGAEPFNLPHSLCEVQTLNNRHSPNVLYTLLAAGADFTNKTTYEARTLFVLFVGWQK